MEQIKEAFYKVKQDIEYLKKEVLLLNKELIETRESLIEICEVLKGISRKTEESKKETLKEEIPTPPLLNQTDPFYSPTHNLPQRPLNTQNIGISTGNQGVPTDKQTNQQANQQTDKGSYNIKNSLQDNSINNAVQIIESLDNLKKEIRLKFKLLTEQELLVFSTVYQSSEERGYTDYKSLSEKLNLTESSIRDYIGRLIKKRDPRRKG